MDVQSLNHYRILSQLGKGGMGIVYLAEDSRLGRQVAVKVMNEAVARDPLKRQRFLQEARAAAALNHPNIATIHSVEEEHERGTLMLVMEYVEGDTLDQLLRQRGAHSGLPAEEAVSLVTPVAAALGASHRRGVVHRDVKSANIMRTPDGRVKVLDFGIAKVSGSVLHTDQHSVIGTLDYMSPEQARGDQVDHRTDLWSLGVVLYELLTGQLPFHAESSATMLYNIVHTEPRGLGGAAAFTHVAPSLLDVLRKALEKDRLRRYQSGEEMELELQGWLRQASAGPPAETVAFLLPAAAVSPSAAHSGASSGIRRSTAERRQITFLCCELMHAVAAGDEADPEEYATALSTLQEICEAAAARYGGYLPESRQPGGLIYFGYPVAHEDDASRAMRAGLAVRDEARARITGAEFELHLGVSTSLAVVEFTRSRTGSVSENIIGEGAKVARALAQLPHSNRLMVEAGSQRLATKGIVYRSAGVQLLPGLRDPMPIFEALGNKDKTIGHGGHQPNLTPLAGRRQELALLEDRWAQALDGQGQVVLLAGSAGMGKSRLVHELRKRTGSAAQRPVRSAEWVCSPFYTSSALHPVLSWVERTYLDLESDTAGDADDSAARSSADASQRAPAAAARLRALLTQCDLDVETYFPVLAPLLSIASPGDAARPALTPERQRVLAMEALLSILLECAVREPLLLVVEDLHWADPSTLDVLGMLLDYVPGLSILAVLTHRPEFAPAWTPRGHVTSISINRLPREEVIALAMGVAGEGGLHPSVLEQLVHNADGTPLFVEELATMVVESGMALQSLDGSAQGAKLSIPKTLRDSFMARLDRLGDARHVAQMASVLGREFPRRLLAEIAGSSEQELRGSLQALVDAEVLYLRGTLHRPVFVFKHALLQEAAYESMVKRDRVALHTRAAEALARDMVLAEDHPELTAHHLQEAGLHAEATLAWHRAGMKAAARSAHKEAIAAFRRALRVQALLPAGPRADAMELLLLASIGPSLVATLGFGAEEVGRTFDRARELCGPETGSELLLPALFGVWIYKIVRGDLTAAEEVALRLVATGEANHDDDIRIEGYWALGDVQFWRGQLPQARATFEKTLALYEKTRFAAHAPTFSQDPMVAAQCYLGFVLMVQGDTEGAWRAQADAYALAKELNHAFSIGWALGFPSTMAYFSDDPDAAVRHADAALQFYAEQAYPFFVTSCQATRGWGLCRQGRSAEGLPLIKAALEGMRAIGSDLVLPLFNALLAESLLEAGEMDAALAAVEEGLAQQQANGATVTEISLRRMLGDLQRQAPLPDFAAARASYERSRALAERCGAARFVQVAESRLQDLLHQEQGPRHTLSHAG